MKSVNTIVGLALLIANTQASATVMLSSKKIESGQLSVPAVNSDDRLPDVLENLLKKVKASGQDKLIAPHSPSEACMIKKS